MAISVTPVAFNAPYALDETQTRQYMHGSLVWTAGTYATGGQAISFANVKDASGQAVLIATLNVAPDTIWIQTNSGSGFVYGYNKATGKVQVFVSAAAGSPLEEQPAGALPAGVVSDVIEFEAEWVKQ